MFRKMLATITILIAIVPALACAANMQVNSSVSPISGGTISPSGSKYSATDITYMVTTKTGWTLNSVKIDGVDAIGTQIIDANHYKVVYNTSKVHTIVAYFSQTVYSIVSSLGPGGTMIITGGGSTNITPGSNRGAVVTPYTNYKIESITVDGNPVFPANPTIAYTQMFNSISANHTINATFKQLATAIVTAGGNKDVSGTSTVLNGSVTSNPAPSAYIWKVTSAPAGAITSFTAGNTLTPIFHFNTRGSYKVTLTATVAGTDFTSTEATITVQSQAELACRTCIQCHAGSAQVTQWTSSLHATAPTGATCLSCHMPNNEAHPGQPLAAMTNICIVCHSGSPQGHPVDIDTQTCVTCHSPHSLAASMQGVPHFNNITSGVYPASYVTTGASCTNCHVSNNQANKNVRQQWAKSGHANTAALPWIDYDFKTKTVCVRCHTTTGFIAYSTAKVTSAWGVSSDKTKEVLTCIGCHSDVVNGIVRTITPNKPYADETSFTNHNVGTSNICMDCHTGMNNGQSIQVKVGTADFTNFSYIAPHYLSAGGSLQGKSAYHFPGRTYTNYSSNSHHTIGMANSNNTGSDGACIACHMSAPNKHAFRAVSSAHGAIVAITTTVCTNCHIASLPAATLDTKRVGFDNALAVLRIQLQEKGFTYSPNYPYFAAKNWGIGQNGANVMGAAFNFKLFASEPGAYAHNPAYARQLIVDSIDAVFNGGTVTGSIDSALSDLSGRGLITSDQITSLNNYKTTVSSCSSCHENTSGSHTAHLNSGFGCVDCHSSTAASNTALVPGTTTHINGVHDLQPGPTRTFSYANGTCSNISCHQGGSATWGSNVSHKATLGSGDILMFTINSTHDVTPLSINENCTLCHYESLVAQHNNNCGVCHSGPNPPANALIGNWDKSCQSCHPTIHTAMRPDHNGYYWNSSASCELCHDTSGGYPGPGDNCTRCHNPLFTVAAVGDHQAPTTTSNTQSTYVGGSSIHLTATDAGTSDVSATWYSLDGNRWVIGNDVFFGAPTSGSRVHTLQFYSTDHAMNVESTKSVTFTVQAVAAPDTTPPATTSNFNPAAGANYKANQVVTLTATDGGSGVKSTYYRIDSGAFVQGTSFTVSGDGLHTISYYSVDNANNTETTHVSNSFRIDTVAPVTTNTAVSGNSYTGSQTFILSATDAGGAGVASTWYQLDSGAFISSSSVTVTAPSSGSASHTIFWYSIDNAGNQEATKSVTFTLQAVAAPDTTPPVTTSNFNPAAGANYKANQVVTLTATDGGSGVKSTYYRIDSGAFVQGTSFTVSGDGLHTISYYSVDNANNTETTHVSNSFRIDTVAPVTTNTAVSGNSYTGSQAFILSATDAGGAGVASTWYQLDSGAFISSSSVTVTAPSSGSASHTIFWYSIDNAGNQEATKSVTFSVQATGGGGGTVTLIGINSSSSSHPYTHFWVMDTTDTNLIADSSWSLDDHTTSATFVVPAGVGYIMHLEWQYPDYESGDPGTDSRVISASEAYPSATVTWQLFLP